MDIETKIKQDMRKLGCQSRQKISLAFHLYLYLVDEKLMYDTEYCYNKDIDTLYVENLCTIETGPTVNLAFIDGDLSTTVYTFTKDMCQRQPAEAAKLHTVNKERRSYINNELYKKRDEILDNALNGGQVDN
ncbi:tRNA-splicing endonuclease subunit Sen15 [Operophtera brumata]|uniref:tRNA-splicing endonuclease subunit Sen15 n=1 Tax=Operophtera brumata TaxID=104452 RepID=A0A0L7L2Z4_OPEBR|nr:tRNA-splicing endonuclease subunit Sen15 [Operophtera brumata]